MLLRVAGRGTIVPLFAIWFAVLAAAQHPQFSDYKRSLAPFVASPPGAIDKMLSLAGLKPGETLYDLGSGDGRIVIAAAQKYGVNAVGIELSERLVRTATQQVKKAGVQDRVKIIHGDIMQADLSGADVVTLYLMTLANENVRPNLERYLHARARVVSYDYPIPGWRPVETSETEGRNGATHAIYLYHVPASYKK